MSTATGRLVVLSGPSCVGKSPLSKALARLHPDIHGRLQPLVLHNSRGPRPGEVDGRDYYFRSRQDVEGLRGDPRYVVLDVRGDVQALDLQELDELLSSGDVFFEGNPFVGSALLTHPGLAPIRRIAAFMTPLSRSEVEFLGAPERGVDLPALVTDVMRRKLLRRTRKQKGELALPDLENIEKRAGSAYKEMRFTSQFSHVIPNHDGEDSDNWDAFYYPLGDAGRSLRIFVALLEGRPADGAEEWPEGLLP
jgi:guanylate kinase